MESHNQCPRCNGEMEQGFLLDHKDHASGVVARSLLLRCIDDLDALARATTLHDSPHLQVWEGNRIVVRMNDHGDAETECLIPRVIDGD